MSEWIEQLRNRVDTLDRLQEYINVSPAETEAINSLNTKWGTTPYFASLMDPNDPNCPIRRQVIPSMQETVNTYGIPDYLIWKENRPIGVRGDYILSVVVCVIGGIVYWFLIPALGFSDWVKYLGILLEVPLLALLVLWLVRVAKRE